MLCLQMIYMNKILKDSLELFEGLTNGGLSHHFRKAQSESQKGVKKKISGNEKGDERCGLCREYTENLLDHNGIKHYSDQVMCEWPGCYLFFDNMLLMEQHITEKHAFHMMLCPVLGCGTSCKSVELTRQHVAKCHPDKTIENISRYQWDSLQLDDIRQLRAKAEENVKTVVIQ